VGTVQPVGKGPLGIGVEVPTELRSGAVAIASNAPHQAWALLLPRAMSRTAALETAMWGAETLQMETLQTGQRQMEQRQMEQRQMGCWASFR